MPSNEVTQTNFARLFQFIPANVPIESLALKGPGCKAVDFEAFRDLTVTEDVDWRQAIQKGASDQHRIEVVICGYTYLNICFKFGLVGEHSFTS